jgi:ABC-2 type transport system permease protein
MPVAIVLSGNLIPLALFPDWLQTFLFVQPLAGVLDIPFRIYSGNLAGAHAWAGVGLQVFWTIVLTALGRAWLERVMRRLEVQGG